MVQQVWFKAADLGIWLGSLIGRLIAGHLRKPNVSHIFNLIDEGPLTDIARDKDKMIGEAVWSEYLRDTSGSPRGSLNVPR
jgi:hypothetical protein